MGYPTPLIPSIRKIGDNVVTVSCPFAIKGKLDVGNRMTLLRYDTDVVIFSPIVYGDYFQKALELLGSNLNVKYMIIVNYQHNLGAATFKNAYPELQVIAGERVNLGPDCPVSFRFTHDMGNRVLLAAEYNGKWGLSEKWWSDLEFGYLITHKNTDVVLYQKSGKILFAGDVVFNLGIADETGSIEQYSPATGFPEKHFPFTGWSFLLRYVHPSSYLGPYLFSRLSQTKTSEGRKAIQMLYDTWEFETIVPCHGNVITMDARGLFRTGFRL